LLYRHNVARPEILIPGNCYFWVSFHDNDLLLPAIDTLVYVGTDTGEDDKRVWLFKQPDSLPNPDGRTCRLNRQVSPHSQTSSWR
jgi:hypothetical protein